MLLAHFSPCSLAIHPLIEYENFGLGTPRIISRYPHKHWRRLVWAAWVAGNDDGKENDQKRMETLISQLSEVMVKRQDGVWSSDDPWLNNAVKEHGRAPFHAVLARSNAIDHERVLVADELDENTPLWAAKRGMTIARTAEAIADAVGDMLRAAADIVFVDPYFAPHRRRFVKVLDACFGKCFDGRIVPAPRIRIFTDSDSDKNGEFGFFKKQCNVHLPGTLPAGHQLTIRRLKARAGGERLHNRYILTELGGVSFGVGLDEKEGGDGAMDDVSLLGRDQYHERWRQYAGDQPEFDQPEETIVVTGTGRVS